MSAISNWLFNNLLYLYITRLCHASRRPAYQGGTFLYIPRQWDSLNIVRFSAFSVFVAQMLKASGNELYYHTWPTESGKHNYEIDFRKDADVFMVPVFMTMFL